MAKKKAIKLAAASAIAASAFVAAAPAQTDAASNVATEVSKAVTQMKKAYHTYSDVTATGKFADIKAVYAEYNAAKKAYANAKAVVTKAGGATKDAYLAQLDSTYAEYIAKRVVTYIDAYNYAVALDAKKETLEAELAAKDWDGAEKLYHEISYELKTRTVILDRVYGKSTRELLRSSFKADAQAARDAIANEVTVKIALDKAEALVEASKLAEAKVQLDKAAEFAAKMDKDSAFGKALVDAQSKVAASYDLKLTPAVVSVKAINAEEIQVVFNKNISSDAAKAANYELKVNNVVATSSIDQIVVTGNTALIRLVDGANFFNGDKYAIQAKDSIKDTNGKNITRYASEELVFNDAVAPTATKASVTATTLRLTFSEPVYTATTLIKVDGIALSSKNLVAVNDDVPGNYSYDVALTASELTLVKKAGNHEVTLFDLKDTTGPVANNSSVASVTYTVTNSVDQQAPSVVAVKALNANRFFIELSETASATNASFTVKKGNHTFAVGGDQAALTANNEKNKVYYEAGTLNNKPGYYVIVTEAASNELNPLYKSGETSATLDITVENLKDSSNLIGAKYQGSVTLSKDTSKPRVVESDNTIAGNNLVVKFDGKLQAAPALSDVVVRNKDGVIIPASSVTLNSDKLEIALASVKDEPYTVSIGANKVAYAVEKADVSTYNLNANNNEAISTTVKSGASNFFKYVEFTTNGTAPVVSNNKVTISYGVEMDASALSLSNYQLDGKALPAGTTADFVGDKKTVVLTFPASSFVATTDYKLTVSTDVTTKDGVRVVGNMQTKAPYEKVLTFVDNVKPVLQEAKYYVTSDTATTSKQLVVKFSEVVSVNPADLNDFKVTINGSTQTVSAISTGASSTDEYVVITLANDVNVIQAATLEVVAQGSSNATLSVADAAGNTATGTVTVSTTTKELK